MRCGACGEDITIRFHEPGAWDLKRSRRSRRSKPPLRASAPAGDPSQIKGSPKRAPPPAGEWEFRRALLGEHLGDHFGLDELFKYEMRDERDEFFSHS